MESRPAGQGPLANPDRFAIPLWGGRLPLLSKSYSQLACGSRGSPSGLSGKFSSGDTR